MTELFTIQGLISLSTLSALEIVLGIDNIIFISILAGRLPQEVREKARKLGILGALLTRLLLLSMIAWIARLTAPLFEVFDLTVTGKSLILFFGGLFLLFKATREIHHKLEGAEQEVSAGNGTAVSFQGVILQIMLLDMVFSLDSVITAVGMAQSLTIMVVANLIALTVMVVFGKSVGDYVDKHPTLKVLALCFLMMIGFVLVAEGFQFHIPKGYIYFAMAFSVAVEMINLKVARKGKPVKLHQEMK